MSMNKFIEYNKMSKKAKKEHDRQNRSMSGFNTGTRVHKDAKHPSRQEQKNNFRKTLDNQE